MGWLPPAPADPDPASMPPWQPGQVRERLVADGRWEDLSYIVVDELHEGVAGLLISPWARLDPSGRLGFRGEADTTRSARTASELLAVLRPQRPPVEPVPVDERTEEQLRGRELRISDAFAARMRGAPEGDPASWLGDQVLDITAEAREAAKAQ